MGESSMIIQELNFMNGLIRPMETQANREMLEILQWQEEFNEQ